MRSVAIPRAFVWRRLHSLMGLWLVLFLVEHLFVNSQAGIWMGERGRGFVSAVNAIHNFPYLYVVEIFLLGVPMLFHAFWGVKYLFTAKYNSFTGDGSRPALPELKRNKAYTWQRVTSWLLLVLLAGHILKFRVLEYPRSHCVEGRCVYLVRLEEDAELRTLAARLDVVLQGAGEREVIASCKDFGTASLLAVRKTFQSPIYVGLYTVFVLVACFHAFNGLWTFLITWGLLLKMLTQRRAVVVCMVLMGLVTMLGLVAIWGTYLRG